MVQQDFASGPRRGMSPRKWEIACSIAHAFAKRGYHGIGMRNLASDLGLNQGTLYHHFPSKDEALLAICLVGQAEVVRNFANTLAGHATFDIRVGELFAAHMATLKNLGDFVDVYASQWHHVPEHLAIPLREGWLHQRDQFQTLFQEAIDRGEIAADIPIKHAIRLLLGIFRTVNVLHRTGRSEEIESFVGFAATTFLKGLTASRGQPAGKGTH